MSFQPSPYSGANALRNPTEELFNATTIGQPSQTELAQAQAAGAKADAWAAGISAVGALASTGITMGFQASALKSQQKHEQKLAKQQEKLLALQTEQSLAQGAANRAAAAVASLGTTKTLLVVGGVLMTVGLIAAAVVAVRRGGSDDYDYEYEDEYE